MDMTIVDVTGIGGVREGDEAVLVGKQGKDEVTAEEVAAKAGTINYELVTRINAAIERIEK
jgi:alanine racemase